MKKKLLAFLLFLTPLIFMSCKQQSEKDTPSENTEEVQLDDTSTSDKIKKNDHFAPESVNDDLAAKIKEYLNTQFLTEGDSRAITEDQKEFQLREIDLNNDGKNEVFVNFKTSYFCGSGGCTILLLSNKLQPITKFTVTRTPLYVEPAEKDEWKSILTTSEGELKELIYENNTYPSNPSLVEKAAQNSPSNQAEILFDEDYKTYSF